MKAVGREESEAQPDAWWRVEVGFSGDAWPWTTLTGLYEVVKEWEALRECTIRS